MKATKMLTRRGFLRVTGGAVAPASLLMGRVLGRANSTAPGDRLGVAVLGLGDRGGQHLESLLGLGEPLVLAVCDPYRTKAEQWRERVAQHYGAAQPGGRYRGCTAYQDYAEILAPPREPPPDLDYELWLGPAPWTPYNELKGRFNCRYEEGIQIWLCLVRADGNAAGASSRRHLDVR
jgi:hypothetical protein